MLYVAEDELNQERVSAELPTFWYMYGPVVATTATGIVLDGEDETQVTCDVGHLRSTHRTVSDVADDTP